MGAIEVPQRTGPPYTDVVPAVEVESSEDDGEQRVAELRTARERGRPIAGVHIADCNEIAGAEKGQGASEGRAAGAANCTMHIGE